MSTADDLQRDEEWGATHENAAAAASEAALLDVHTCLPGIVAAFHGTSLTVQVTPAIQRHFVELGAVNLPDLINVPVVFPSGGGYILTFPVAAGDEVLLVFGERAIDGWWQNGGVNPNDIHRLHDLSDAFAIPGIFSQKARAASVAGGVASGGAELRSLDGTVVVRVDSSGVTLGSVTAAQPGVLGTALFTYLTALALTAGGAAPTSAILATQVKMT